MNIKELLKFPKNSPMSLIRAMMLSKRRNKMPVILTFCLVGLVWLICQTYSERRRAYRDCYLVHQTTLDLMRELGCPDSSIELMKDSWTAAAVTGSLKDLQDATLAAHNIILITKEERK